MPKPLALALLAGLTFAAPARAEELLTVPSPFSVASTIDRLRDIVIAEGFTVVARVPHSAAAEKVDLDLRPTELLIFGKPQGGTPVMACDQRAGLDLPLRALAYADEGGQVRLAMPDPASFKVRYGLGAACDAPLAALKRTSLKLIAAATKP